MADSFSYKIPTESELFSFDFSQVLTPNEIISTASCTIEVMNGTDPNVNDMLAGAPIILGQTTSQRLEAGLNEVTYRLIMTINTTLDSNPYNTYVGVGDLTVFDATRV